MPSFPALPIRKPLALFIFLLPATITLIYLSPSYLSSIATGGKRWQGYGTGYVSPATVLSSYDSRNSANGASSVRVCLPQEVGEYVLRLDEKGSAGDWLESGDQQLERDEEHELAMLFSPDEAASSSSADAIPVQRITRLADSHLAGLRDGYNAVADRVYLGLDIGPTWDLQSYRRELLETYHRYLALPTVKAPSFLPQVLSRISLRPPIVPLAPRPRQILTTDKHPSIEDLPWEFKRWTEIMPDWEIRYFDDAALVEWVQRTFGGTEAQQIWEELPRPVLKADIFRYMAMLVEGGIYTDSDTAPIIHADRWGYPHQNGTDALLSQLSRIASLAGAPYVKSEQADDLAFESNPLKEPFVNDGAELGPPSLVVSVESDAIEFGWDNWREVGLSRAVQIVQWTFMARPGHPVFLDAIGRTLKRSQEYAEREREAKSKGETFLPDSALDWTGPGVFTDCVYRWLLTRYGFHPRQLIHQKEPIRIGDVLILPAGSYSSVSPFTGEDQRDWAASFHGFFGRWRDDDPKIVEFERLKKIKEQEEAEAAKLLQEQEAEGRTEGGQDNLQVDV